MNQLNKFSHESFGELSTILDDEKILFAVDDVAWALSYTKWSKGREYLRHERIHALLEKHDIQTVVRSGQRYVNESGLYDFIFEAGTDAAKEFRKWVTEDVLPSIRKHGGYLTPDAVEQVLSDPDTLIRLATNLKEERSMRIAAETRIQSDEKYTNYGKVVSLSDGAINVGAFAKIMYDKHGVNIGRNKLMAWLRDNGYLMREGRERNFPKQVYVERGWIKLAPTIIKRSVGDVQSGTPLITGKGQVALADILLAEFKEMKA